MDFLGKEAAAEVWAGGDQLTVSYRGNTMGATYDPGTGAFVITSRVSVDMVQKTVIAGAPALIAVSAPTALAVDMAENAGLTLAAFARGDGFDLYAHSHRITDGDTDVA